MTRTILCQEDRELRSLYFYIYTFVYFLKEDFARNHFVFSLVSFFTSTSTFMGYSIPKLSLKTNDSGTI